MRLYFETHCSNSDVLRYCVIIVMVLGDC